jgi:hypothetical protein
MGPGRTQSLIVTAVVGLLSGAAVALFAFLVARYGPSADGWSFRGNGALAVYTLVPVLLAGGWTAIVLRARSHPSWLGLGLGAGLVALVIALADAALLPLFGSGADVALGAVLLVALALWTFVAPILAALVPKAGPVAVVDLLAGVVVWLIAIFVGLYVVGVVIPAGS